MRETARSLREVNAKEKVRKRSVDDGYTLVHIYMPSAEKYYAYACIYLCLPCQESFNQGAKVQGLLKMAAVSSVVDAVVDNVCTSMEHSGSGDLSDLDMILVSIMSSSSQVGVLLDKMLVTRQRHVEEEVLRQLHMCLNQLCLEYETKLFIVMSMSPGRSAVSTTATSECRGRPKKIINIGLV